MCRHLDFMGVNDMQNYGIVGRSDVIHELRERVRLAARVQDTVLLLGERGTGKDLAARAIHAASGRPAERWMPVCCGALTGSLAESEIFGHVQGAFTGARGSRGGLASCAAGGTLFLNEIGVLPLPLQAKFLHLVEEKEYRPVGGTRMMRLDTQIVAATNADLGRAVHEGRFLPDLLDRLTVFPVALPALRDRREDVPILLRHFFGRSNRYDLWRKIPPLVLDHLAQRDWPGNVRQLRNLVRRIVISGGLNVDSVEAVSREYSAGEILGMEDAKARTEITPTTGNPE